MSFKTESKFQIFWSQFGLIKLPDKWLQVQGATQQLSANLSLLNVFFWFFFPVWELLGVLGGLLLILLPLVLFCFFFNEAVLFLFNHLCNKTALYFEYTKYLMYKLHCINTMLRAEEVPGDLEASKLLRFQMANAGEKLSMTGRCLDMQKLNHFVYCREW